MTLRHASTAQWVGELQQWCRDQEHSVLVADAASTAIIDLQAAIVDLREIKVAAVRDLAFQGWSETEIAKELGITRARVHQITK